MAKADRRTVTEASIKPGSLNSVKICFPGFQALSVTSGCPIESSMPKGEFGTPRGTGGAPPPEIQRFALLADSVLPFPIFIKSMVDRPSAMSVTTRWPTAYTSDTILKHGQTSKTISAALRRRKGVWRCNAQLARKTWNLATSAADENWSGSNVHQ